MDIIYNTLLYLIDEIQLPYIFNQPISIAERSEASTVFGRSDVEITGSNPAQGMDVCVSLCCVVLCR
jgi:hypothetical protein